MRNLFALIFSFLFIQAFGQTQPQLSSGNILLNLQKLKTVGSVLYIAAHPDDENTRLLTYLANEKKLYTTYLSLTRGDGGQNLIGKEHGELLGLIRTQELLEARKLDGAHQRFTRAVDFGFSKNPEETFEKWNYDSVLYDVVWTIRRLQPDIIINRFPTTGEGGHGHHTASAILAEQAFKDAADKNKFPDQLQYTKPWQAKRLFWNTFNFGSANTISDDQLKLDIGKFNPLTGEYYGETAAESRSMHKSQGFGAAKSRGKSIEYFKQIKGDKVEKDLFENMVFDWNRFEETKHLNAMIDKIIQQFNPLNPSASVNELIQFYQAMKKITTTNEYLKGWLSYKMQETEEAIVACSGVWAEVYSNDSTVAFDDSVNITSQIVYSGNVELSTDVDEGDNIEYTPLAKNKLKSSTEKIDFPEEFSVSYPYWLRLPQKNNFYQVSNPMEIGMPESAPVLAILHTKINDMPVDVRRSIKYKYVDPVRGEVVQPLKMLPALAFKVKDDMILFPDNQAKKIDISVKSYTNNVSGKLKIKPAKGWRIEIPNPYFTIQKKNGEATVEMIIGKTSEITDDVIEFYAESNGVVYDKIIENIYYEHIQPQYRLKKAELKPVSLSVNKSGDNIAYITGSGDDVADLLSKAGYNVAILDNDKIRTENLSVYNAVITGIRAFNTNEYLLNNFDKLMQYVEDGGNLIVQYNTSSNIGPLRGKIAPYPFDISRMRVTDENADVRFLNPQHVVFNHPNKITQNDFKGWVQERGLYFANNKDKAFESVLSMNDKNEQPHDGSLIIAKYGKGNYVYTGLSFFRQLPAGVNGAYKLLANLISLPKNK